MTTTGPSTDSRTVGNALATGQMNSRAWAVVGMLVLFQIVNFADKAVIGLIAGPAIAELGLTAGEFGFIGSAFFFLFAITAIAIGFVAGRVSTRWIILVMGISWAVLQFPMFFGGGAAILLVSRIMLGAAEGPATPISLQHAHGWFAPEDRGLPSSFVAAGSTLGPIVAAPALAWIIANPALGWRWAFGSLGIVGLLWSLGWLLIGRDGPYGRAAKHGTANCAQTESPPEAPRRPAQADRPGAQRSTVTERADRLRQVPVLSVFTSPMFWSATLAGAGCFWAQGFLATWSPKYLTSVVDLSPEMVGVVSTFPWVLGALALLVIGYVSRRMMRRGATVRWALGALFGGVLTVSGICFVVLQHAHGYLAVALLTLAAGLAMTFPIAPSAAAYAVAPNQRGAIMATITAVASIGGVISPAMVGALMDRFGYVPPAQGEPETAEMALRLADGMGYAFGLIGIYLITVGAASILLLNPDKTATRLQYKHAGENHDEPTVTS